MLKDEAGVILYFVLLFSTNSMKGPKSRMSWFGFGSLFLSFSLSLYLPLSF